MLTATARTMRADWTIAATRGGKRPELEIVQHVDFDGPNCLPWPFARSPKGQPSLHFNGSNAGAARVMCIMAHGESVGDSSYAILTC